MGIIPYTLWWMLMVNGLANLNGTIHALVYWQYMKSFLRRMQAHPDSPDAARSPTLRTEVSLHVDFATDPIVVELSTGPSMGSASVTSEVRANRVVGVDNSANW